LENECGKKVLAKPQKTRYANLIRSSGIYFAHLRVAGKLVRKSKRKAAIIANAIAADAKSALERLTSPAIDSACAIHEHH